MVFNHGGSKGQRVVEGRCRSFLSGLISEFVFYIWQFPTRCTQICCGCFISTCTNLVTRLSSELLWQSKTADRVVFLKTTTTDSLWFTVVCTTVALLGMKLKVGNFQAHILYIIAITLSLFLNLIDQLTAFGGLNFEHINS